MWCKIIQSSQASFSRTGLGEQRADLIGQQMCDAGVEMVDGLLHGLHPEAQCVTLSQQHGVLLTQVAVAL